MGKHGNYHIVETNTCFAIGFNKDNIHQYVVWRLDSNEVSDAIFFETYLEAKQEFINRSKQGGLNE